MLAYEITQDSWYMDWFLKVHDYSFKIFPDRKNSEWHQKCDPRGNPVSGVVALPVKDPFHLSRAVMFIIRSLDRILKIKRDL